MNIKEKDLRGKGLNEKEKGVNWPRGTVCLQTALPCPRQQHFPAPRRGRSSLAGSSAGITMSSFQTGTDQVRTSSALTICVLST